MISILIPSFAEDFTALVLALHKQMSELSVPAEVIVGDNAGDLFSFRQNEKRLEGISKVTLYRNSVNIGRAGNRNKLASLAKYPYLLFIDADAEVASPDFLKNYVAAIGQADVVVGGTAYRDEGPTDESLKLRYVFGRAREQKPAQQRAQRPFDSFTTFNFLVSKACFEQIKFDERVKEYGHEDTVFGFQLKSRGYTITHIDNPLIHNGLISAQQFLASTEVAITNLHHLKNWHPEFSTRLIDVSEKFSYLLPVLAKAEQLFKRNLLGDGPSLFVFDLYKLAIYHKTKKATKSSERPGRLL